MRYSKIGWRKLWHMSLAVGLAAYPAAVAGAGDGFLSRLEDLPLVPGLSEDTNTGVSFDTAAGRIVEAFAHGNLTERQVLEFYRDTLPQLGWTAEGAMAYRRGGERLRLEFMQGTDGLIVRYSLSPQ